MNKTFYRLNELVSVPLSDKFQEEGKWQGMYYEAQGERGVALVAGECVEPSPIEVDLKVSGWHRIYIALGTVAAPSAVGVSLSGDKGKTVITPTNVTVVAGVCKWNGYEYAEESFYKAADLTGQKIIFEKPAILKRAGASVVLYIRVEEMSDAEVNEYKASGKEKRIMWHFDYDYLTDQDYDDAEEYLGRLKMIEHGNGDILNHECFIEMYPNRFNEDKTPWKKDFGMRGRVDKYLKRQWEIKSLLSKTARDMGMKIYGGYRVERGDFQIPYDPSVSNDGAYKRFPEFCCKTRDGKSINALSFAYAQVREMMTESILDTLPDDWDGVSLYFHRGVWISFEKPVVDEVFKRYGVDARRLPRSDARLHGVHCLFITEFIRKLKMALDKKAERAGRAGYEINVVAFYDAQSSKYFGLDVETLLKEKLIDSVSQGLMAHYEDIDDCLDQNGLIDLEKYTAKKQKGFTIVRRYSDDAEIILNGAKGFLNIQKKYGGEFYAALAWENKDYPYQLDLAKKIYEAGAEKLISWNGNHQAKSCSKLCGIKACGDKEKILKGEAEVFSYSFRLTDINGSDISEFDPNWRG